MAAASRPRRRDAAPDRRRAVPSVDALLRTEAAGKAAQTFGRAVVRQAIRETLDAVRADAARGRPIPPQDVVLAGAMRRAARGFYGAGPVINATGVLLHTGLGRAPLADRAVRAVAAVAGGYADLELDRDTGRRGRRTGQAEFLLRALTGAEAALVVNNNAAALLLALAALSRRKEVLVSRGELIEIGGEFRLPEIMAASGAKLVEVGTTNRTRRADYDRALTERTALVLKVHPSNYRVTGFAETVELRALVELAHRRDVPVLHDLGSGLLRPHRSVPSEEPSAAESLAAGADLLCFSGDKLFGGPQAGIVLGRADLVERLRRHPIARAVRLDVLTVAALEATLRVHAAGDLDELPLWRAMTASRRTLSARARELARSLPEGRAVQTEAVLGGGSVPGYVIPSVAVRLESAAPEQLAARLRAMSPPVFCRVDGDAVLFDLRTVDPGNDARLGRAIRYALRQ